MLEDYNSSDAQKDEIAQGVCAGILTYISSLQAEPVSKELEEAMTLAAEETRLTKAKNGHPFFSEEDFFLGFSNGAQWQEERDNICYEEIFEEGAAWKAQEASEWLADNADYYGDDAKALQIDFDRAMAIGNKED